MCLYLILMNYPVGMSFHDDDYANSTLSEEGHLLYRYLGWTEMTQESIC